MSKLIYLESLRGLAALVVVLNHYQVAFFPASYIGDPLISHYMGVELLIAKTPLNIFFNGNFAVCIFFVLSGYVLVYKYFKYDDFESIKAGAVKRYFRLLFPIVFSIAIAHILLKLSLFFNLQVSELTHSSWWFASFWTFEPIFEDAIYQAFVGVFLSSNTPFNPPLWTINIEFLGSYLVFSFCALFGSSKNRLIFYVILIYALINTYYLGFILGMMLCDFNNDNHLRFFKNNKIVIFLLICGLFFGSYPTEMNVENTVYESLKLDLTGIVINYSLFYHTMGAALVLFSVINSKQIQQTLSSRIFMRLGQISYSMYVIHFIILGSLSCYLFLSFYPYFSYMTAFLLTFLISILIILTTAHYMTIYIDSYSITKSKDIYEKNFKGN